MQLLVSVRSAAEVGSALSGGADIIDAKEPQNGSLGPVSSATLAEILALVPSDCSFSIALGDLVKPEDAVTAIASIALPVRAAPTYLKLGFAGVRSPERVTRILATAVAALAERGSPALVVGVAYADATRAGTLTPDLILGRVHSAGAAGVLLDTYTKDGIGLLEWITPTALGAWVEGARHAGLLTAVAGSLTLETLDTVVGAGADVVGVRGAACHGGRQGQVQTDRVRALRRRLDGFGSSSVREDLRRRGADGETRDGAPNLPLGTVAKFHKANA
ncbi:MAG TPA: (5-formylfuran-3-yl)methyl phosphate synthase [Gemmatimonadales bacterium]|nr:(5-formylfuran-3-yl)methyl phosphate synthase [Gemmatimonadales bacterium]